MTAKERRIKLIKVEIPQLEDEIEDYILGIAETCQEILCVQAKLEKAPSISEVIKLGDELDEKRGIAWEIAINLSGFIRDLRLCREEYEKLTEFYLPAKYKTRSEIGLGVFGV